MKIIVKAKPSSKIQSVELLEQAQLDFGDRSIALPVYKVCVKEPPVYGKSNEAIISALTDYFQVSKDSVKLISGRTAKQKIFEIDK